ncbi:hypothetical protein BJX66DRAFT_345633 [Aspergillus keveii]|uniref:Zn(2)-C6 fungal-type domain-containing protein n=1 Tax=Aspergillus keveii TaxID=714993 RepID=A0ABR4FHE5_9EURO
MAVSYPLCQGPCCGLQQNYFSAQSLPLATGQQIFHQLAPLTRGLIACTYCRRRKIRCDGYEGSVDGRCTNCVKKGKSTCEFKPVSPLTQTPYQYPEPMGRTSNPLPAWHTSVSMDQPQVRLN